MDQEYIQRLSKIENEIERWLPKNSEPAVHAENADWAENVFTGIVKKADPRSIKTLTAPLEDMMSRGGKRWRPLLMTLVCETLGGGDAAIPLTPAVEFSHNASLIHDDIEDDSEERRGKPAIHKL